MTRKLLLLLLFLAAAPAVRAQSNLNNSGAIKLSANLSTQPDVYACKPGPWGELEYYYIYLEAPPHIMEYVNTPSMRTMWNLPQMDESQIREFLTKAGVPQDFQNVTIENSIPFQMGPPYRLYPPPSVVEGLSPETRQAVYQELRRWPENKPYRDPVIIASGNVQEWFEGSGLSPDTVRAIERVCYPLGNSLAFSDLPYIIAGMHDEKEERRLLKAMTRTRSMILRLKITPESDFEGLKDYWTAGFKNKDVLPLFESIVRTAGVDYVDTSHLLPPVPRKYLYSYPSQSLGMDGIYPDSFWISMNFFRYIPDEAFDNMDAVMQFARTNFVPATEPFTFGDLLLFTNPDTGKSFHSCIFIADDIVYTKNGRSVLRPFVYMRLRDLVAQVNALQSNSKIEAWRIKHQ